MHGIRSGRGIDKNSTDQDDDDESDLLEHLNPPHWQSGYICWSFGEVENRQRRQSVEKALKRGPMSRIDRALRLTYKRGEKPRSAGPRKAAAGTYRKETVMPTITPFLWFDTQAEEAMNFYASIFKRSNVISVNRAEGKVMSVQFELEGQAFMALNAGPQFPFTEAISFFVGCQTQQEIDELWAKLTADGGTPSRCGWLKDKFGLSWQIIPNTLGRMLSDKDPAKSKRVMNAMLQMGKLDLKLLQQAYNGE
jgi:predicted 3-demethylubiquinone-9 3-methyltransferase (glyoxalase superfamily)